MASSPLLCRLWIVFKFFCVLITLAFPAGRKSPVSFWPNSDGPVVERKCTMNYCTTFPGICQNGGSCKDNGCGGYCICSPEYTGHMCETATSDVTTASSPSDYITVTLTSQSFQNVTQSILSTLSSVVTLPTPAIRNETSNETNKVAPSGTSDAQVLFNNTRTYSNDTKSELPKVVEDTTVLQNVTPSTTRKNTVTGTDVALTASKIITSNATIGSHTTAAPKTSKSEALLRNISATPQTLTVSATKEKEIAASYLNGTTNPRNKLLTLSTIHVTMVPVLNTGVLSTTQHITLRSSPLPQSNSTLSTSPQARKTVTKLLKKTSVITNNMTTTATTSKTRFISEEIPNNESELLSKARDKIMTTISPLPVSQEIITTTAANEPSPLSPKRHNETSSTAPGKEQTTVLRVNTWSRSLQPFPLSTQSTSHLVNETKATENYNNSAEQIERHMSSYITTTANKENRQIKANLLPATVRLSTTPRTQKTSQAQLSSLSTPIKTTQETTKATISSAYVITRPPKHRYDKSTHSSKRTIATLTKKSQAITQPTTKLIQLTTPSQIQSQIIGTTSLSSSKSSERIMKLTKSTTEQSTPTEIPRHSKKYIITEMVDTVFIHRNIESTTKVQEQSSTSPKLSTEQASRSQRPLTTPNSVRFTVTETPSTQTATVNFNPVSTTGIPRNVKINTPNTRHSVDIVVDHMSNLYDDIKHENYQKSTTIGQPGVNTTKLATKGVHRQETTPPIMSTTLKNSKTESVKQFTPKDTEESRLTKIITPQKTLGDMTADGITTRAKYFGQIGFSSKITMSNESVTANPLQDTATSSHFDTTEPVDGLMDIKDMVEATTASFSEMETETTTSVLTSVTNSVSTLKSSLSPTFLADSKEQPNNKDENVSNQNDISKTTKNMTMGNGTKSNGDMTKMKKEFIDNGWNYNEQYTSLNNLNGMLSDDNGGTNEKSKNKNNTKNEKNENTHSNRSAQKKNIAEEENNTTKSGIENGNSEKQSENPAVTGNDNNSKSGNGKDSSGESSWTVSKGDDNNKISASGDNGVGGDRIRNGFDRLRDIENQNKRFENGKMEMKIQNSILPQMLLHSRLSMEERSLFNNGHIPVPSTIHTSIAEGLQVSDSNGKMLDIQRLINDKTTKSPIGTEIHNEANPSISDAAVTNKLDLPVDKLSSTTSQNSLKSHGLQETTKQQYAENGHNENEKNV